MSDFRSDLAAILVDREEQARLDAELGLDAARVDVEFGVSARSARARQLLAEFDALEALADSVRELVRVTAYSSRRGGSPYIPRGDWKQMTTALVEYDAVKDRK